MEVGTKKRLCPECREKEKLLPFMDSKGRTSDGRQLEPKICTSYWRKPGSVPGKPIDCYDWEAYIDGEEESGRVGYGSTEEEAIANLKEQLEDL